MNMEILKQYGFCYELDLIKSGKCPFCESDVRAEDFKNRLSVKEFKQSGLCQICQDKVFE